MRRAETSGLTQLNVQSQRGLEAVQEGELVAKLAPRFEAHSSKVQLGKKFLIGGGLGRYLGDTDSVA